VNELELLLLNLEDFLAGGQLSPANAAAQVEKLRDVIDRTLEIAYDTGYEDGQIAGRYEGRLGGGSNCDFCGN